MHHKLNLKFLPQILDDISQRSYGAKIFRCGSLFQYVRMQENREKKHTLELMKLLSNQEKKKIAHRINAHFRSSFITKSFTKDA